MPPKNTPKDAVVYAVAQCGTEVNGVTINLKPGDCWAADDPVVLQHPGLFQTDPIPRRSVDAPVVETATRAPGQRR